MLKSKLLSSLAALGAAFCSTFAIGAVLPGSEFNIGEWSGSAHTQSNSAEISFCTAQHGFSNGVELSVARSVEGVLLLGVKSSALNLATPGITSAKLAVDDGEFRPQNGVAVTQDTMLFALPPNIGIIYAALLSSGSVLNIESGQNHWQLDLRGVRDVMTAIGDCIDRHGKMQNYAVNQPAPANAQNNKRVDATSSIAR